MALLLAGRGALRAATYLAPLPLLVTFGSERFSAYAGAVGVSSWAMFISFSAEKTALKIVPRMPRISPGILRLVMLLSGIPVGLALVAIVLTWNDPTMLLIAAAFLWSTALGLLQISAALHRLRAAPLHDAAGYLTLAAAVLVITALSYRFAWSPLQQLLSVAAAALIVALGSVARLPRSALRWHSRAIAKSVLRNCLLLGAPDLLGSAGVGVCYLVLALAGLQRESGPFFLAALASTACSALMIYLLRLGQPATSAGFRGSSAAVGRCRAQRHAGTAIALSGSAVGALLTLAALGPSSAVLLIIATVAEIATFAVVTYAAYLLENTDERAPLITARAAAAGFAATGLAAIALIPMLGATGAMTALIVGQGTTALTIRWGLITRYPSAPQGVRS